MPEKVSPKKSVKATAISSKKVAVKEASSDSSKFAGKGARNSSKKSFGKSEDAEDGASIERQKIMHCVACSGEIFLYFTVGPGTAMNVVEIATQQRDF